MTKQELKKHKEFLYNLTVNDELFNDYVQSHYKLIDLYEFTTDYNKAGKAKMKKELDYQASIINKILERKRKMQKY